MKTRERERLRLQNLQLDINDLHQEIFDLHRVRNLLFQRALQCSWDGAGSCARRVHHYFTVMKDGFQPIVHLDSDTVVNVIEYIRSVMHDRVRMGRFVGVRSLLAVSNRYAKLCKPMQLTLLDVTVGDQESPGQYVQVSARFRYTGRITRAGVGILFHGIVPDHIASLAAALVDEWIEGVGKCWFVFDSTTGKVTHFLMDLDFPATLSRLIRRPDILALLLESASVSTEYYVGDVSDYEQDNDTTDDPTSKPPETALWKMRISELLSGGAGPAA